MFAFLLNLTWLKIVLNSGCSGHLVTELVVKAVVYVFGVQIEAHLL
jgi:hypothetical protein